MRWAFVALLCLASCTPTGLILTDTSGQRHAVQGVTVLYFVSIECPMSSARLPRMIDLCQELTQVAFFGVNSNCNETAAQIAEHAKKFGVPFPMIKDEDGRLADRFKVDTVPAAVVLENGEVRYRGRIDDHKIEELVRSRDLRKAIEEVLAGKSVSTPETPVEGCLIKREDRPTSSEVTYARHVAPILNQHCVMCHFQNGPAPFSLADYTQARAWAKSIVRSTHARRMPPWKAATNPGMYRNERRLTDEELATLDAWATTGAPMGDPKEIPPPPRSSDDWLLGKPDAVLNVEAGFELGARGADEYRCYVVKTNFDEDKWVKAVVYKPGNLNIIHHPNNGRKSPPERPRRRL